MEALALLVVMIIYEDKPMPVLRAFPVADMVECENQKEKLLHSSLAPQIVNVECEYIDHEV